MPSIVRVRRPPPNFTLYLDESGTDGRSPNTIIAGYLSQNERWQSFSYDWVEELGVEPAVECLHACEVYNKRRPLWPNLDRTGCEERLERFAAIINRAAIPGFAFMVENAAASDLPVIPGCSKDHVLNWCFFTAVQCVAEVFERLELDSSFRIAVVCDKLSTTRATNRRRQLFKTICELAYQPNHRRFLRIQTLDFKDDRAWPPLQAADLLAWQYNRTLGSRPTTMTPELSRLIRGAVVRHTLTRERAVRLRHDLAKSIADKHEAWLRDVVG